MKGKYVIMVLKPHFVRRYRNLLFKLRQKNTPRIQENLRWNDGISQSVNINMSMEFLSLGKKHWQEGRIGLYEDLIRDKSWWDTVDHISSTLMGGILKKYP
jgi:3-methyladenine DNA glycosylase AlkD